MASNAADSTAYFDRLAATGIWQDFSADEQTRLATHLRLWDIRAGQTVLEPGCGAGRLTAILAERVGPGGHVIACDPAAAMIARAVQRRLPAQVTLQTCAVEALDLPTAALDRVICFHAWPHFGTPASTLALLTAAMRPGACLWISHLKGRDAINSIHRNGPPEIQHHLVPTLTEISDLLAAARLTVVDAHDGEDGVYIGARR